jgi:hypothetical protein
MDGLERLLAIEDIKRLEAARGRLLDTQDWAGYREIHAPEIVSHASPTAPLNGVDAMIDWLSAELKDAVTVHHVHSPEIDFDGPDRARAIWAMEAMTVFRRPDGESRRHGYGYYHVDYERRGGAWKISGRRQIRTRVDTEGSALPR